MDAIGNVLERKELPALARFKRVAVENKAESIAQGKFVGLDVDYVYLTPPYSKDEVIHKVKTWFERIEQDAVSGRIHPDWVKRYREQYRLWQQGQEMPVDGTPVRGWSVLSPARQELYISLNILTVEAIALMNDEGMRRVGMGSVEERDKAKAWLAQAQDKGPLTQQMAAVSAENRTLKDQIETLTAQVTELAKLLPKDARPAAEESPEAPIGASELLEPTRDELIAAYTQKFGTPPHHRKSDATLLREIG